MPFIAIPHTTKVIFTFMDAQEGISSIGLYFAKTDFTEQDLTDLLDALAAGFATDLMAQLDTSLNMQYITAYDMRAVDGLKVVKDTSIPGSSAGNQVTGALCSVVTFRANKRGKWNSGRNYVPGLNETNLIIDTVLAGTYSLIVAAYQTLIDTPPVGWRWVVASRYLNGAPRPAGVTADVATVIGRSQIVGFQRRRVERG